MTPISDDFNINPVPAETNKILLVSNNEDDKLILCAQLNISEQRLKQVQSGLSITHFERLFENFTPDLIIIDMETGTQRKMKRCLEMAKSHFHAPLLGLFAKHSLNLTEKILLLVDDLLLKPYSTEELHFRVKILLALSDKETSWGKNFPLVENRICDNRMQSPQNNKDTKDSILRINDKSKAIYLNNTQLKLGPTAYNLFYLLIKQAGKVVSTEEITAHLWPDCKKNKANDIYVYINKLRSKFNSIPHHHCSIETINNIGYSLRLDKY